MTEQERIEKDAIKYVIQETGYQVLPEHDHWKNAYIAGAYAQLETIKQLKGALGWFLPIARWYYESSNDEKVIEKINIAKQLIE